LIPVILFYTKRFTNSFDRYILSFALAIVYCFFVTCLAILLALMIDMFKSTIQT